MNCAETRNLIDAYLDKQLDAANTVAVEKHLSVCPACQRDHAELVSLQKTLRTTLPYHKAPPGLSDTILSTCSGEVPNRNNKATMNMRRLKYGLSLAASIFFGYLVVTTYLHQRHEQLLIESILSSHINALSTDRLTDINGSSAQLLTPWLTSKLDYAPKVYNPSQQGFELLGARTDALHKQRIAALAYRHEHHLINVYTWPAKDVDDAPQEIHHTQGYHFIYWCKDRMNYWIVSDLDLQQLQTFASSIQQQQTAVPR